MADKVQLIKEEIERRYNCEKCYPLDREANVAAAVLQELLLFIDSLPEESGCEVNFTTKNEDLEEEIGEYFKGWNFDDDLAIITKPNYILTDLNDIKDIARHFAEWQKQKDQETIELAEDHAMLAGMMKEREELMKDAVEGLVGGHTDIPAFINLEIEHKPNVKVGDKVKIVVLKTE